MHQYLNDDDDKEKYDSASEKANQPAQEVQRQPQRVEERKVTIRSALSKFDKLFSFRKAFRKREKAQNAIEIQDDEIGPGAANEQTYDPPKVEDQAASALLFE